MKKVSSKTVASRLKAQWGVEMEIWEVVENSAEALRKLGMLALDKVVEVHRVGEIDEEAQPYKIRLPEYASKPVWAIQLSSPYPWNGTYVELQDIIHPPQIVWRTNDEDDELADTTAYDWQELNYIPHVKGTYIDFKWDCPYMEFNYTDFDVAVMYTKLSLDEEGYPKIPEDAVEACAQYCHFVYQRPRYVLGKINKYVMDDITEWKRRAMAQAKSSRMFDELSQNAYEHIFNIMSSMDRKHFGINA